MIEQVKRIYLRVKNKNYDIYILRKETVGQEREHMAGQVLENIYSGYTIRISDE
jgi:hypothetical protein